MPNALGFQMLGNEVACIDCDARGFIWDWPEKEQVKHFEKHVAEREAARQRAARLRAKEARRLGRLKEKENEMAYGGNDAA